MFITLHLAYLLIFFLSLIFYNIFFSFLTPILKKKILIFYSLRLEYLSLHTWPIYTIYYVLIFIILQIFSLHFFFEKLLYKTKNKWYFTVAITTSSHFSTTLKINLRYYIFLLTHMIFTLFYYMYASVF